MSSASSSVNTRSSQNRESVGSSKTPRRDFFTSENNRSALNGSKRSPVSPTRITRLQEKEEMQSLNDRLIIYIDTVRQLESENNRLKCEMSSFNEVSTRDVSEIKVLYERELEDAKRLIDELAKEKAKYEIEVNTHKANSQDAIEKLARVEKESKESYKNLLRVESELSEYKTRCDSMKNDLNRKTEELKHLKPQNTELEKHLNRLRKQLEEETLLRVDLENKNSTLKEDLNFKSQIYEKETDQLRSSKRNEIEQVDCRLKQEYDSKLMSELNLIRNEMENKIREMKDDVERTYQNKYQDAETNVKRSQHTVEALREELSNYTTKNMDQELDIKNLTAKLASYEQRFKEYEERAKKQSAKYEKDLLEKEAENDKARTELNTLLVDYQELYDIKIALDMEIEAYRKILEAEEKRLNISASQSMLASSYINDTSLTGASSKKSKKRKVDGSESDMASFYQQSSESKVGLDICEYDFEAKSMKFLNKTDKDLPIGGWAIKQVADGQELDYKLPKSRVVKAGETLTIWSASFSELKQPEDLVMSGNKQWLVGNNMITILNDKDGNECSRRECRKITIDKKIKETSMIMASSKTTVAESKTESKSTFGKLLFWNK